MPQTVKVVEGVFHNDNDQETCCIDDILIFHRQETLLQVSVSNTTNEVKSLPLLIATKVLRVDSKFSQSRVSCRGILQQLSKVLFLIVVHEDNEIGLKTNEIFRINYDSVQNYGDSFSFVLESVDDLSKKVKVTQDSRALFQPIIDPKEYLISEIVRKFGLPQFVLLVDNLQGSDCVFDSEENDRVLKLERTFTEQAVIASTTVKPDKFFRLQKDSEISICPTLEAELQDSDTISRTENMTNTKQNSRDANIVLYEDMSSSGVELMLETQGSRLKESGRSTNRYTPTPSAKVMKTFLGDLMVNSPSKTPRKSVYGFPKLILEEAPEIWHKEPKIQDTHCCGGPSNRDTASEPAQLTRLDHVVNDNNEHIYQEINFRELPEEYSMKCKKGFPLKCDRRKSESEASDTPPRVSCNRRSATFNLSSKWSLKPFKNTQSRLIDEHSKAEVSGKLTRPKDFFQERNDSKIRDQTEQTGTHDHRRSHDPKRTNDQRDTHNQKGTSDQLKLNSQKRTVDQQTTIDQKGNQQINNQGRTLDRRQDRTDVHVSGETVVYKRVNSRIPQSPAAESTTSMSTHQQQSSSPQHRSPSIGNLLGNSITKSLSQNKLFASKSGIMDERPPLPPPRSSSMKPAENTPATIHGEKVLSDLFKQDQHVLHKPQAFRHTPNGKLHSDASRQDKTSSVYTDSVSQPQEKRPHSTGLLMRNKNLSHKLEPFSHAEENRSLSDHHLQRRQDNSPADFPKHNRHAVYKSDSLYEEIGKTTVNTSYSHQEKYYSSSRGRSVSVPQIPDTTDVESVDAANRDLTLGDHGREKPQIEETTTQEKMVYQGNLRRSKTDVGTEASKATKVIIDRIDHH